MVQNEDVDAIWCLGDLVGYGPEPNEVTEVVRDQAALCLAGNHDLCVLSGDYSEFSDDAAVAARWTEEVLTPEARSYLETLSPSATADGTELFHGSPRDPVWDYVLTAEAALDSLLRTSAGLVLVGHSHVPLAIRLRDDILEGGLAPDGHEADLGAGRWLLNPGSVGRPRDGDARAALMFLDFDGGTAAWRRVSYPVERTQAQIREEKLPDVLAQRLAHGM